ncbi:hypothetical protein SIAM614_30021 [Stappia aggregata IAM 12614]|uniref:Uncharacterized protein n=1 Tax=Roseibium aggregatum (strain ATCC 25650 / DSM 13394 / JCM 20685 / NBRC 16684 / NCIMB 2208 / IAM 12614 / B1) TaxID=384765 RepID=A0P1X6_ROSAI|nr:hypothetical protein SIAM614_30021 [Stappia aggregata IAM 12614] [Roseibium aggregatum IAM 12614]
MMLAVSILRFMLFVLPNEVEGVVDLKCW